MQVEEAEKEIRNQYGITIPFPDPRPAGQVKYALVYAKPVSIMVVGSYALKTLTSIEEGLAIDLAVAMPRVSNTPFFAVE